MKSPQRLQELGPLQPRHPVLPLPAATTAVSVVDSNGRTKA